MGGTRGDSRRIVSGGGWDCPFFAHRKHRPLQPCTRQRCRHPPACLPQVGAGQGLVESIAQQGAPRCRQLRSNLVGPPRQQLNQALVRARRYAAPLLPRRLAQPAGGHGRQRGVGGG